MALQKQPISLNFSQGLDTKTDDKQVQIGKFLALKNMVFDTVGRLTKRNGFANVSNLPNTNQTTLTTLNDNLIATGTNLYALNAPSNTWLNQGTIQPVQLATLALVRNSTSQASPDTAISTSGSCCVVYMDNGNSYYHIVDSTTGYQVVSRTLIPNAHNPRTFVLGRYFIVTYTTASTLSYIAIPIVSPNTPLGAQAFSSSVNGINAGYDGLIFNNTLYLCWAGGGGNTLIGTLSAALVGISDVPVSAVSPTLVSLSADVLNANIYIALYDGTNIYAAATNSALVILLPSTLVATAVINELTSYAANNQVTIIYENANTYGFTPASGVTAKTDYISNLVVALTGTVVSGPTIVVRGVGLASKPFAIFTYTLPANPSVQLSGPAMPFGAIFVSLNIYFMITFGETNQFTYFLTDITGNVYMRLAATNGAGYEASQVLPNVTLINDTYSIPYSYADFLATVNTGQNKTTNQSPPLNAIYTQTGVNLAKFTLNTQTQHSSEIADSLHLTGGQLWQYDGVKPVEQNFQVFPSPNTATLVANAAAVWSATGGAIVAQPSGFVTGIPPYYYQFCYEWTDNNGNLQRSTPSIPISVMTTGTGTTGSIVIYVPTLRMTYKALYGTIGDPTIATSIPGQNPVRITCYRWSVAQQVYYQVGNNGANPVTSPVVNDPTVDYITFTDVSSDAQILGNTILYTTGGVVEDTAAPPSIASTLFDNRLWLIDAEDRNLLWFSKQVIEAVPVEMSDLLTLFVAPTAGAQGSTGEMAALAPMDDKLIIFKKDAIYYIDGTGPDNTGANSQYSNPVFITGTVGCANPNSIVLMPSGLMFQSDKGIWLLGRDLTTSYIGAPVELYNTNTVMSAQSIPATNQVRFILDNNITLMYDYFVGQWGTHSNSEAISGTLYQGMQTYLNNLGLVFQETPGTYVDGANAVLMSFTTSWINLAGLQGYERFYFGYLLGTYFTPFTLDTTIAYDYNDSATQNITIRPDNYSANWGAQAEWGSGAPWGGPGDVFEARFFPHKQKCESFQITVNEVYDSSFGVSPGQGLTLSGLNLVVGMKKGYRTQRAARSFGSN